MNKAVFLDRDGTINLDTGYLYEIERFQFIPGAVEGMRLLQDMGFMIIIITNQSGIARGYYTEEDYHMLTDYMLAQLKEHGVYINDILYCPHHPQGCIEKYRRNCDCRKPGLKLFWEAQRRWNIDLGESYAIGDKLRDCSICMESACRGYVIGNAIVNRKDLSDFGIECAYDLLDAAGKISESMRVHREVVDYEKPKRNI